MISSIFNFLIVLFFPFTCYFIYIIYTNVTSEKENNIFFDITLLSSVYLCIKITNIPIYMLGLIYIPLIICIYKKRFVISALLSILISVYVSNTLDIDIWILMIKNTLVLAMLYSLNKSNLIIKIYGVLEFVFIVLLLIFYSNKYICINNLLVIVSLLTISIAIFEIIILVIDKFHDVNNLYHSLDKIKREKKLYESLFKISHEIKNPLAVCKGYLDMLDVKDQKKANKYIGIISQEIDRTLLLLQDFSMASKLDVNKNEMDINMLLLDVCEESKIMFKKIKFKYKVGKKEIYIYGDYNRLKQVFINLIKNARESIKKDGTVSLWTKLDKKSIIINIKDNGSGISKENIENIGKAFFTTKKKGTGLGICFSKEIVEKHNGDIKYISKKNKGTHVIVTLPLKKASIN